MAHDLLHYNLLSYTVDKMLLCSCSCAGFQNMTTSLCLSLSFVYKKTLTAPRWNIKHTAVISEGHVILQESCAVKLAFLLTTRFFRFCTPCSVFKCQCSTCCHFRIWVKPPLRFLDTPMKLTNWKTTMFHSHKLNWIPNIRLMRSYLCRPNTTPNFFTYVAHCLCLIA